MTGQTALDVNGGPSTRRDSAATNLNGGPEPSNSPPTSYDLRLFKPQPDGLPQLTPQRNGFSTTSPDPQKEGLKHKVAERLIAGNAQLRIWQPPYEHIAHFEQIPVEEARRKYRDLELRAPEGGNGLQIVLRDDEATIMVPLWHKGCLATEMFRELWSYLQIICQEAGYGIYDPQLDRILEPTAVPGEVLEQYKRLARHMRGMPPAIAIRLLAASEDCVVLVAVRENGASCGFAQVCIGHDSSQRAASAAYLKGWYVDPQFRGRGIGRRLLESAELWAAARGFRELASDVSLDDEQIVQAHLACGFAEIGRAVHFIKPVSLPV